MVRQYPHAFFDELFSVRHIIDEASKGNTSLELGQQFIDKINAGVERLQALLEFQTDPILQWIVHEDILGHRIRKSKAELICKELQLASSELSLEERNFLRGERDIIVKSLLLNELEKERVRGSQSYLVSALQNDVYLDVRGDIENIVQLNEQILRANNPDTLQVMLSRRSDLYRKLVEGLFSDLSIQHARKRSRLLGISSMSKRQKAATIVVHASIVALPSSIMSLAWYYFLNKTGKDLLSGIVGFFVLFTSLSYKYNSHVAVRSLVLRQGNTGELIRQYLPTLSNCLIAFCISFIAWLSTSK